MALYDAPPHSVTIKGSTTATESGGYLTKPTYTTLQASVSCSINTSSSAEREAWGRLQITVTHRVAFLASILTTTLAPGMKLVADDTGQSYLIHGIALGRSYGAIPAFVYADVEAGLN